MEGQLKRSSLGRTAFIGELYDARQEAFSSQSLLRGGCREGLVEQTGVQHMEFDYSFTDNLSERFDLLKVEADLQVSVLMGLVTVGGSGSFLKEESSSARSVSCALICRITTVCEKFFAPFGEIIQHVDLEGLKNPQFTHFVTEVTWGANCLLSLTATCREESRREEVKGRLSAKLAELKGVLSGGGGGGLEKGRSGRELDEEVAIKVSADVVPEGEWPRTVREFQEFVGKVPELLRRYNGGKGKPLEYVMTPLRAVREAGGVSLGVEAVVRSIDESFLVSTMFFFEEVGGVRRRLNDLVGAMGEMRKYVWEEELAEGREMQARLGMRESELKRMMSEEWGQIRSGRRELRELVRRVEQYKRSEMRLEAFEDFLEGRRALLRRLGRVREYLSLGVVYLGREEEFASVFSQNLSCEFLVLLVSSQAEAEDQSLHSDNTSFFLLAASKPKPNTKYVVVDFDFRTDSSFMNATAPTCLRLRKGKVLSYDAYADHLAHATTSFIRLKPNSGFSYAPNRPPNRIPLEIPCPAQCSPDPRKWVCFHCTTGVEYGFDEHFYCSCGSAPAIDFHFRCSEDSHGDDFSPPATLPLKTALSALSPFPELNILVLGQSGTGKSTWINSIVNYLSYSTLQDAQRHGVICTIPARFSMPDRHDPSKNHIIRIGADEGSRVGDSVTKTSHTYSFLWGGKTVRIIDTPGLGDSAGIDQDKRNLKNIVTHLGYLKELHAVCILLKSSETVINNVFKYCLQELFIHLHKDVARNILFCFTNARATFYAPGPTAVVLRRAIEDMGVDNLPLGHHNMFCLENEAFLFLCSLGHPEVSHSPEMLESYTAGWNLSVSETLRLFETITTFVPHCLQHTLSLVTARNRILNLSKPIVDISKTLEMNLASLERKKEEIQASDQTVLELSRNLSFKEVYLESEPLKNPRTVCTSPSCIAYLTFRNVDVQEIEYKTHCHSHCNLKNVEVATVNNPLLVECDAMGPDGKCKVCGCGWEKHMHMAKSQVRRERQVLNTAVQSRIMAMTSEKERLESLVAELEAKMAEYREEKEFIFQASVKFGAFLWRNSITVYNDSMEGYLKYLIELEDKKPHKSPTEEDLLRGLKDTLAQYKEEVKILQEAVQRGESAEGELTVEEVLRLEKDLYKLKNWGELIKSTVEEEIQADHKMAQYRETPIRISRAPSAGTSGAESTYGMIRRNINKFKRLFHGKEGAGGD